MNDPKKNIPLKVEEILNLHNFDVEVPIYKNRCNLASDRWLCVQDPPPKGSQIIMVNLVEKSWMKRNVTADAAVLNSTAQYLALQSERTVQIFDLLSRRRLKSTQLADKNVSFWKWVTEKTLVIVVGNFVLHWSVTDLNEPIVIMQQSPRLAAGIAVDYKANDNMQWLILITVSVLGATVTGCSQLQSMERGCFQLLDADTAVFTTLKLPNNNHPSELIAFASHSDCGAKLCIAQLGKPSDDEKPYLRKSQELEIPNGNPGDFPVAMEADSKFGFIFIVWKQGFLAVHDVETAECLMTFNLSIVGIFTSVPIIGGLLILNKMGNVVSVTVDLEKIIPYLESKQNLQLSVRLAMRSGLPASSNVMTLWFDRLWGEGKIKDAALFAASAPNNILRTPEIVERIRQTPVGGSGALMAYFGEILDHDRLTTWEALELCRPVIQQGRNDLIEKWLREDRLDCSESLGDLLFPYSKTLALSAYIRSNTFSKAVACFAALGKMRQLLDFAVKMSYTPDFISIVLELLKSKQNEAFTLVDMVVTDGIFTIDLQRIVDLFMSKGMHKEAADLLLKAVHGDDETTGELQTKLLSIYLLHFPHMADEILSSRKLSHYDKPTIASMCENAGLMHHALSLYKDPGDWQRILSLPYPMPLDIILPFFSALEPDVAQECLRALLSSQSLDYENLSVKAAIACYPRLEAHKIQGIFTEFNEMHGLFLFLNHIVNEASDEEVAFSYIVICVKLGFWFQLEDCCRTCQCLNATEVCNYLMNQEFDQVHKALMIICDRFNLVKDLVVYLLNEKKESDLTMFVSQINCDRAPEVIDHLLSQQADESLVQTILTRVPEENCHKVALIAEKHNKLALLLPWLENLRDSGSSNSFVHTTIAKIVILTNSYPERFLNENSLYDCFEVGRFCESRNPELSIIAYSRGHLDEDLMRVCKETGLLKAAARYLLHRCDINVWTDVLSSSNPERSALVENTTNLITSENFSAEEITILVKALMAAEIPGQLVTLLETLVFDCHDFAKNRNLQNLLILSAIKSEKEKVKDYIISLNDYDAYEVAAIAKNNDMFEEAFAIYDKCGENTHAINILLNDLKDMTRASAFAQQSNDPKVWVLLGKALLEVGEIKLAIDALIRARDASAYALVVEKASKENLLTDLVRYLEVAREYSKEPGIDSELLLAYARVNRLGDLNRLASEKTTANVEYVADCCTKENLLEAAKILYLSIGSHARLAETLAKLGDLESAVCSARKAGGVQTWRVICSIALNHGDLEVARLAGRYLAAQGEEIEDIVLKFESMGYYHEIVIVLESLLSVEQTSTTIFTQLSLLYIRYEPIKCRGFLNDWWHRVNIPKILKALEENHMWCELGILLENHGDYCEAITIMMAHPTEAWNHVRFKDLLLKVINSQWIQPVIQFYGEYKPMLLNDLLLSLGARVDAARVVSAIKAIGHLPLCRSYLESRLPEDNREVNGALCELLIQQDDWVGLKNLLETQKNTNGSVLATQLEDHDLLGFRLITVDLYRRSHRWADAMRVCQKYLLHREAVEVAAESCDSSLVQSMLTQFLTLERVDSFSAALLHCYHLIQPDVVLELAWRFDVWPYAMPYFIQIAQDWSKSTKAASESGDGESPKSKGRMLPWTTKPTKK